MQQSKLESALEQTLNVGSGFILSYMIWITVITPVYDIQLSTSDNLTVTLIFTVVSLLRGYVWRRLFNGRVLHKLLTSGP